MSKQKLIRSCSIWRALEVVGDKPTLLLLESLWLGSRRFSEFHKQTGLLRTVISNRLKKLLDADCIEKIKYCDRPARYEYRGTQKFRDLYPVALSMLRWERKWGRNAGKISVVLTHTPCEQSVDPVPVCGTCKDEVDPRHVDWAEGPGVGTTPAIYSRRRKSAGGSLESVQTTLFDEIAEIIGDRWSGLIIRSVFTRINSFNEIQADTHMATNILTMRLSELRARGILKKADSQTERKQAYKLTAKGRDIYPVLLTLMEWGDSWYADAAGPPLVLSHRTCGADLAMSFVCPACRAHVVQADIQFKLIPAETLKARSSA